MASRLPGRALLGVIGSLRAAAILLVLLMVAMGAATVYETGHGTEQALSVFYGATWFRVLLALLAANIAAAVAVRYPFHRTHIPFLLAHGGLLAVLAGSLVTAIFGIDGQLTLAEGETGDALLSPGEQLTLSRDAAAAATLDLSRGLGRRTALVEKPAPRGLDLDGVHVEVLRYAPDVAWEREITDDAPQPRLALEVSLAADPADAPRTWVLAGEPGELGGLQVELRHIETADAWQEILTNPTPGSLGTVQLKRGESVYEFPLERCLAEALPVGDTGFTVRVLRYLPHATVGPERTLVNASDNPVNPAIEAEVVGAAGRDTKIAFARFPDFHGRASTGPASEFKLYFRTSAALPSAAPIELLAGPEGRLAARLTADDGSLSTHLLTLGQPLETPWAGHQLIVTQRLGNARAQPKAVPQSPPRRERQPALYVAATGPDLHEEFWLQKGTQRTLTAGDRAYRLLYADPTRPLGFTVTLNQFRIGYYPGGERPRSFESSVRFTDPATGRDESAVISMNRPAAHRGYTLYQSSYQRHGEQMSSTLSVSRDPGRPVVFTGYAATVIGMALLLARRLKALGGIEDLRTAPVAGQEGAE